MTPEERLHAAYAERRAVLGDAYVDAALDRDRDPTARAFQDHLTGQAWGAWARQGPLSRRDRSLLVLAMTAALGRMEEFRIHAGASEGVGVADEELDDLLFMIAGYCGGPAALAARREVHRVRDRRGERG